MTSLMSFHIMAGDMRKSTCKILNDIKIHLSSDVNNDRITFHLVSVRVLLGVKLHHNDNEKTTSMRKQFRVRSS